MRSCTLTRRSRLTTSGLALATVLVVGATPLSAQSLLGSGSIDVNGGGAANIDQSVPNQTTVTLNPGNSVINWTPNDNATNNNVPILFQDSGTTATFESSGNFAVLNNINSTDITRQIYMDGTINSLVNGSTGGSVYFYAPGGFILGSNAMINVGSLVLSASPISNASFTGGGSITFGQALNPNASIVTNNTSQIMATNNGSYVAMVAPRIQQLGAINVNGAAALVAAEGAVINFSPDGLFDIQVTSGTTDTTGIASSGDINGVASSGAGDYHRIYMVAVPKNQALTMALYGGSTLGFAIAGAADKVGNTIILSAGKDISGGAIDSARSAGGGTGDAGISMQNVNTTSALVSDATYNNIINASGTASMVGDVSIHSDRLARVYASTGGALTIDGDVSVSGSQSLSAGQTGTAANAEIWANGGTIGITGDATISADATGAAGTGGLDGATVTGGSAYLGSSLGGSVTVNGSLAMSADAIGGATLTNGVDAGSATGGSAQILATDTGSTVNVAGTSTLSADAIGGSGNAGNCFSCDGIAGFGQGGNVYITTAFDGGSVSLGGDVTASADGTGGNSNVSTGRGDGGGVSATFAMNGTINLSGGADFSAIGTGGTSDQTSGGYGKGGSVKFGSQTGATGGSLTVAGLAKATVDGIGGNAIVIGAGGTGEGGTTDNGGSAGTIWFQGGFDGSTVGYGGDSGIGAGGLGLGGQGWIDAFGADVRITGNYSMDASGDGGDGVTGGIGRGGSAYLASSSTLLLEGSATLIADGTGGDGFGGNGALGEGGFANVRATGGGTNTITGDVEAYAYGFGGDVESGTGVAGNGDGGTIAIHAGQGGNDPSSGTLTINGFLTGASDGIGGYSFLTGATNGSGFGAEVHVYSSANSSLTVDGSVSLSANGSAGFNECSDCGGGGYGNGGNLFISSNGIGSNLTFNDDLTASADGYGGVSSSSIGGGLGKGGSLGLHANDGGTTNVQYADLSAIGYGGYDDNDTGAGRGEGGNANVGANSANSSLVINSLLTIDASGLGGISQNGAGGSAQGGVAGIYAAGSVTVGQDAYVLAHAEGGSSNGGAGGDALGGQTYVSANGGDIAMDAGLLMDGSASGGSGLSGGNAVALVSDVNESGPVAAGIYATNNGTVVVTGAITTSANAQGGNGFAGAGGNATAGETEVIAYFGDVTAGDLTMNANAVGGAASNGADGGTAQAGEIDVAFGLGAASVAGTLSFASVALSADATGGVGGQGVGGNTGGNAGAGGDATGGNIFFNGSAAGGSLIADDVAISATGTGGAGGAGGNGDSGAGGNGGAGGIGTGGFIQSGTVSASGAPGSGGDFTATSVSADTSAFGGAGGDAGEGGGGIGVGGNGGAAYGGQSFFLIRGVDATVGTVTLAANATGGDGGSGSVSGNGGNAFTGNVDAESKDRFDVPTQRGNLVADSIIATAIATGGSGAVDGTSTIYGGSYFRVANGDASIGSVSFTIGGDIYDTTYGSDYVSVRDGSAVIGSFSYNTTGGLTLDANNGSMSADSITLAAGTFLPNPPALPAPTVIGTYSADTLSITTFGDFITNANLESANSIAINAPGRIEMLDVASFDSAVFLSAGQDIVVGIVESAGSTTLGSGTGTQFSSIDAGGDVSFEGPGAVNGGNVTSGGTISGTGKPSISVGDLDAGNAVFFTAALGGIATGNVVAGGDVLMQTPGQLTVGTIDTDGGVTLAATGALAVGDIVAGTNADIQSGISIAAGAVDAGGNIYSRNSGASSFGVLTAGGDINVGSIGALTFTSADAGETVRLGSDDGITGGTVVAGDSIVASTYGLIELGNLSAGIVNPSANSSALYEVALVAGSLDVGTINAAGDVQLAGFDGIIAGDVTTSERMFAVSDGNIALGNISTGGQLLIGGWDMFAFTGVIHVNNTFDARPTFASSQANTLGSITVGTIAGSEVDLYADGNIAFSNVNADDFEFDSGGAVTGGNIVATSHAGGEAEGAIMLGNITVSGPSQIEDFSVGFASNTSIQVGTVSGYDKVGFATLGTLTTGNVTAGSLFIAMVGGNTQTGSITTDPAGEVYLADSSMFAIGGGPDDFDASIVLALNPVPTAGSININGPVSTGRFRAATSAGLTVGTLTADAIEATADQLTLGNINSSQAVILSATSGVTTGNIITDSAVDIFSSAGGISTGDILAGTYVLLEAGGNITTGNVAAGLGGPILGLIGPQDIGPGNAIEMFSDASINTGDLSTDGYIGLYAAQNVTTGTLTADHDIVALAGGNASFGAIDTPERFVLAGYSNLDALYYNEGFHPEDLFDNFALAATGGNATFGGSSNVGDSFRAFVGGNTTIQSLAVGGPEFGGYMGVDTGGLLSINGAVSAYYAQLLSGDIALGAQSSLSAYGVLLASRNASGMFIGDNLSGQGGYRIGQAEVDRISTDSLSFYAFTDRGAGSRMTIGDLTYNALQNFDEDPLGFAVVSDSDEAVTGTIRIVGNLAISASVDQEIDFGSTTFEIDAATGSLAIDDGNGGLGGTLQIDARDVFVASGAILDKLEANPRYQGYIAELNAPASVQRPDGVLRTAIIEFNTNETAVLENLLIQNTGTAQLPAGFVISELALSGEEGVDVPPGQINLVINGQIQTEGGTVTGIAVRDLLVSEFGTEAFVAGSTINGCLLTGGCSGSGPGPGSEPGVNITPTQITMINGDTLNNPPFGNEGDIDDGNEGDSGASSPISAPQPLFDTRQLTPEDDFNEPISGAGNPSLYGVSSDEDDEDEDEDDKDKSNEKTNARTGDGQ